MRTVLTARDAGHHRCQGPGLYRMQLQGPCIHRAGTGTRRVVWARKGPYLCLLPRKTSNQPAPIKDYPTIASVEQDTDESIRAEGCFKKVPN